MPTTLEREQAAAALRQLHASLLASWNRRDAEGFAALFTTDGNVVGFDGSQMDGRAAIQQELHRIFVDHLPAAYVAIVREVRELGPGTGLLRAVAGMIPPGETQVNPRVNAIQSLVAQREGAHWRIQLFQNTPAAFHGRPQAAADLTAELQRQADGQSDVQTSRA
ncbi:MAG TPA: SgcJ/EcaC family oxidoreductase [Gemmatimonadales bacterium]|nr:SgcJ/EcaC family oxidoreductase [Gemmatimonadales bacterium]